MANSHILVGAIANPLQPVVRRISTSDLYYALARGYDDFAVFLSYAREDMDAARRIADALRNQGVYDLLNADLAGLPATDE